jgi:hypothetical protein
MRRPCVLGIAATLVITGAARHSDAGPLAPRMTVEDQGRKNHVVTILGANLVMVAGLNRTQVTPALGALDRHLQARLSAGEPAVVYPEVVVAIVKAAVLRGWAAGDTATVLAGALRKIDEGHSPEMTRQKVVLAIVRNEKASAVLAAVAAEAPVAPAVPVPE